MHQIKIWTLLVSVCIIGNSCTEKPPGFGEVSHLFVVSDETVWQALQPTLREVFERVIITPQPEVVFELFWVPPDELNQYATRKNVALIGTLDSDGEMSRQVAGMLSPGVREKVAEGSAFVFPRDDQWARDQLLLVIAGADTTQLRKKLLENRDYLYATLRDHFERVTDREVFEQMEQVELSEELLEKYGWRIRIQHDYFVTVDRADLRFVKLRRSLPGRERWLFVHWVQDADPNLISEEWVVRKRNELTGDFYHGDRINPDYVESSEITFLDRATLRVEGLWENVEKSVGGPFRSYAFYDNESERVYLIDMAVFYPGGKKEPFLRQLEAMARSFKTRAEISNERS